MLACKPERCGEIYLAVGFLHGAGSVLSTVLRCAHKHQQCTSWPFLIYSTSTLERQEEWMFYAICFSILLFAILLAYV